ncbi:conserved hypothetical protein [Ricinus communis]|uniref:RNase H type-1 domain-containing protein n=1 Tax=Ricinus communis TaxID=3988 RepID=B9SWL6_RICCO|nr:conserved hypothetical protein [Ricinus communis]
MPPPTRLQNFYRDSMWKAPPIGSFQINTDASIIPNAGTSAGIIICDHIGKMIASKSIHIEECFTVEIVEALA